MKETKIKAQYFYTKKEVKQLLNKEIIKVIMEEPIKGKYTISGFVFTNGNF
ncbi:MAG: hypothetical protein HGA87_08005, partial [Desulfobulbaceae bacterium]|nr:hypothetical protein [Desulfobulbaceae bacterium]